MFLDRTKFAERLGGTALLVCKCNRGLVIMVCIEWHPDEITILADPDFEEVAAVIIFGQWDLVPGDGDLVTLALSDDITRRVVKSI